MSRNNTRNLQWGSANRPKVSNKPGIPHQSEGSDGDIQIRQTNLGAKLFGKIGGRWSSTFLSSEEEIIGTSGTKIGMDSSGALTVDQIKLNGQISLTSTGASNVCIGKGNSDKGTNNVLIGKDAGRVVQDGAVSNIAIGTLAGFTLTSGDFNIVLGVGSALSLNTGQYNTVLGYAAGLLLTDEVKNTFMGHGAGFDVEDSNTICIGNTATASGQYGIAIGDSITAATNTFVFGRAGNDAVSTVFAGSGGCTFTFGSDERRKTNIKDIVIGLDFINELRPRTFNWKPAEEHPEEWHAWEDLKDEDDELTGEKEYHEIDTETTMHGFIAQEGKEVLDKYGVTDSINIWTEDASGMQRFNENKLIIPLIKAVQELSAKLDTMQTEINNLKAGE